MNIGLFFGSFNPIHQGHLIIAESALQKTELDEVWMVVSPQNPFKSQSELMPEKNRLELVKLGIGRHEQLKASDVEFGLEKPSYTIHTLEYLHKKYSNDNFSLIMGQDNLHNFHKWKDHRRILELCDIYVYPRGKGGAFNRFNDHPKIHVFKAPLLDISATYIRQLRREGASFRYLMPEAVWRELKVENKK